LERYIEKEWRALKSIKDRNRIGVWGFGNVSRDVVLFLADSGLGKEIVFYGRPKEHYGNRAGAWVSDLRANTIHGPRLVGTNRVKGMADLDVIFFGVGVPRKEGQTRRDLLSVNTEVIADTCLEIKELYKDTPSSDLPVLVFLGNPVTALTWVAYKVTGFPASHVMGTSGHVGFPQNLSRRFSGTRSFRKRHERDRFWRPWRFHGGESPVFHRGRHPLWM
jgi:malate/lactate dehydrogenase